jgi:hypothetical protein
MGRKSSGVLLLDDYFLATIFVLGGLVGVLVGVVLVVVRVNGVGYAFGNLVGSFGDTLTERVVVTVVVVISHITLVLLGCVGSGTSSLFYSNLGLGWVPAIDTLGTRVGSVGVLGSDSLPCVTGGLLVVGVGVKVGVTLLGDDGTGALAELTLRDVDLGGRVVCGRAVDCIEVAIVGSVLNLDVCVGGGRGWGLVAVARGLEFDAFLTLVLVLRLLGLLVADLLVDMDILTVLGLGTTLALLLVDVDLLLDVGVAVVGSVDGG